jgi:hypothetical protein
VITLIVRPHRERGGYHLDRFDAYHGDKLLVVSRQPLYDGARALLDLGADPDALLTIRHAGKDYDSFVPHRSASWRSGQSRSATGAASAVSGGPPTPIRMPMFLPRWRRQRADHAAAA